MRILVADQDVEHRGILVTKLKSWDHKVQEALSEREVLDICREKCPDLIFIDKELSGVSGFDISPKIRQLGGHAIWVPIIIMARTLSDQEMLQGLDAGVDDFLLKPIPEIQLFIKVKSAERHLSLKEEVFSVAHNLVVANRALESIVTQDLLTGMGNSNSFDDALEKEWFEAKRTEHSLGLIVCNLDFFQAFNQTYGATMGDKVIKQVAEALKSSLPIGNASLARLSGETFAILLPNVGKEEATKIAEGCRAAVEGLQIPHVNSGCSSYVTASFGVSVVEAGQYTNPWDLKEAADYALYQAKHHGRNRSYFVPAIESTASIKTT